MPAMTPVTPLEQGAEIFQRVKTPSVFDQVRSSTAMPALKGTESTEMFDTDFEDESEFEDEYSPKGSFESDDGRRRSQTTISSYDEAPTPNSTASQRQFELGLKPVEGPRGPHLFRASQTSAELDFDLALQMSPLFEKDPPQRVQTSFSDETVTPIPQQRELERSIVAALSQPADDGSDPDYYIRHWTPQQVIDWMYSRDVDASVIECFEIHDIDGAVLLDLQFEDLKELDIQSFGKRHQLWSAICDLRGERGRPSPQPTPFQDISRPCSTSPKRSLSRSRKATETPMNGDSTPISPSGGKKRRGRRAHKDPDVITPGESVSIVAIEQLMPKPHTCSKGERCAKWRKQQRELKQLQEENGIGRFPISPTKGGHIFVAGDPGNAMTAENIVLNVRKQQEDCYRPRSEAIPSVVASSDLLGPSQLPEFALQAGSLDCVDARDPQDNVKQFLNFQHMHSPLAAPDDAPPTPPADVYHSRRDPMVRSESTPPLFPAHHYQAYPSLHPPLPPNHKSGLPEQLKHLPKLNIPRSASAAPKINTIVSPDRAAASLGRSITASSPQMDRFGTPASEMDVPVTAFSLGPVARDSSQSVPPNMLYRPMGRTPSRLGRRQSSAPNAALPAVKEGEVFSPVDLTRSKSTARPTLGRHNSSNNGSNLMSSDKKSIRDPAHHSPTVQHFGYGADCTHAGWMKKRRTKMLRHDWQDAHFRLRGTQLGVYADSRLTTCATDLINTDDYAVACSTVASGNKLSAAMKVLHIKNEEAKKGKDDPTAFAFQLVPAPKDEGRRLAASGKTHHFAVKTKDERIDWMRELMLAKALQAKGKGFEVEINGEAA